MASITKRASGSWQAKVRKRGYPAESKTFPTKAQAERWTRLVESEMDRRVFRSTVEAESMTLGEVLARYLEEVVPTKRSSSSQASVIKLLDQSMGHLVLAAITPSVVKDFRDWRVQQVSGETTRKNLLLLSRILSVAQREWDIYLPFGNPVTPVGLPKPSKARERRLALVEEDRLMKAAEAYGGEIPHLIRLAIETGARRGELVSLRWRDVDLKRRTALLRGTKNGDDRRIPLSTKAAMILRALPRQIDGRVFRSRPDSVSQAFARVRAKAKLKDLRFHDLRHEATSRFFELGLNTMEVSAITGHKDLAMLKRYTHLRAEDLAERLG